VFGIVSVHLPRPGLAMFDSLRLALEAAVRSESWDVAIVLPVDHPLVSPDTVRTLLAATGPAAIPSHAGKHGHPVALAREVALQILAGDLEGPTLRDVLHRVGAAEVAVDDPGVRANCNTPETLAAAWRSLR